MIKTRIPIEGRARQGGAALLLALFVALTLALAFAFRPAGNDSSDRSRRSHNALLEARTALIGAAASRPNTGGLGLLSLPDLGSSRNSVISEGVDAGDFTGNAKNLSVIGRLPWRSLGLAPLRDENSECLWYAVSGSAKNSPLPASINWDSIGHFEIITSDGTPAGTRSSNADPHSRPLALVIAPGAPLDAQNRATSANDLIDECGGNYDARNYLDTFNADARINNTVNYFPASTNNASGDASATPKPLLAGNVDVVAGNSKSALINDLMLPITAKDVFDVAKQRSDFKSGIDNLINDLANYLNGQTLIPANLPSAAGSKGFDAVIAKCLADPLCPPSLRENNSAAAPLLRQWRDNFLYAGGPGGNFTVNGQTGCKAVLIFGGERMSGQIRATAAQKDTPAMYLEGANAALFPNNGAYAGAHAYNTSAPTADIVRCITGLPPTPVQVSFTADFSSFYAKGTPGAVIANAASSGNSLAFATTTGSLGGCFWSPIAIPLLGRTVRAYYEFQFAFADDYALSGTAPDRGYGFTLQLVRGDIVASTSPPLAPDTCGQTSYLGALNGSDVWGMLSYIVENDVYQTSGRRDPAGNHVAIMRNGDLEHPSTPTGACNGVSSACRLTPANTFEEAPAPLPHNQRIEIVTGCNSNCTQCIPAIAGTTGYTNARVSVWVDCIACANVGRDYTEEELIFTQANRDFSAPGDWQGNGWIYTTGGLNYSAGGDTATLPNSALTTPAAAGKTYRLQLGVRTDVAGTLNIGFGGDSTLRALPRGSANLLIKFDASGNAPLTLKPDATWQGALTQASVVAANNPSVRRCQPLPEEMYTVFFGLTGGFTSAPAEQGVTVRNLYLRSDPPQP